MTTKTAALLTVVISLCLVSASSASATATYVFDPTLSLTGNCKTSSLDEVPDPGLCPIPPGVPGKDHPSSSFKSPNVTTDAYGDIYVVNGPEEAGKLEKNIEVFGPDGTFITEFEDKESPQSIAVDSKGDVYVYQVPTGMGETGHKVMRFQPTVYEPEKGEIKYETAPVVVLAGKLGFTLGFEATVAVDASDRLYVNTENAVWIFKSAAEGNALLKENAIAGLHQSRATAIDSVHKKIYVSDKDSVTHNSIVRIFELESPYKEVGKIDGSTLPGAAKKFLSGEGSLELDVDDPTGTIFVGDVEGAAKVYEFKEDGTYLATIEHSFVKVPFGEMAVDDGPFVPKQRQGYLFVSSNPAPSLGHVYAFKPNEECAAEVESTSLSGITETEAVLHATINPCGLETTYRLEYVSQEQFEEEGGKSFEEGNATVAGEDTLPKGGEGVSVSAPATELEPGAEYRFRVFAENAKGEGQGEKTFKTFPAEEEVVPPEGCPNEALRTGPSALLPDCRAYELVTPPSTNGRAPSGGFAGYSFPVQRSTADGNRASFQIEGGALPGTESAGSFSGDPYLAIRGSEGWSSSSAGPTGEEAVGPTTRGLSPDQEYSFWQPAGEAIIHLRYPDGHSELAGRGSLGEDPNIDAGLITEGATHIIFATRGGSAVQLEPNAPAAGTAAVYDRSAAGPTRVVSLLPGDVTPAEKQNATYLGASEDGEGIVFAIGGTIYLRLHEETFEVAGPGAKFAGVAVGGSRVFYLEGGNLLAFDAEGEETIEFSSSGDVTPVNIATSGTCAYFVSPSKLTSALNPNGEEAEGGKENLYLSEEGQISFVGIVTERDVKGEVLGSTGLAGGLGLWLEAIKKPAVDPSRTTPGGTTFLFESRADLTEFESGEFAQVYRYDATEDRLDCLSCNPTDTPPTSDASLQSITAEQFSPGPGGNQLKIANQSPDGKRAFFQTAEPLAVGDVDEQLDVYEWEEEEVGGCETERGCVYLISGRHTASPDYLLAMSSSGDDVFFKTSDQLLPRDKEATLSIYDARVGGGFPEPQEGAPCAGVDTCQSGPTPPPSSPQATTAPSGEGNFSPHHCPKGKHAVKKGGKTTCVKKHHRKRSKHRGHRTGSGRKGGAK